ncbi:unnamed protein product [Malus baccata var. baccata]
MTAVQLILELSHYLDNLGMHRIMDMMWIQNPNRCADEYLDGIEDFIDFANNASSSNATRVDNVEPIVDPNEQVMDIINDIFPFASTNTNHEGEDDVPTPMDSAEFEQYEKLLKNANQELYLGYESFSVLTAIVELMHGKIKHRMLNRCFDYFLGVFKRMLPKDNCLSKDHRDAQKQLYMSSHTATDMRWHKEKRVDDDVMRHPVDGEAWKEFDRTFPEFAANSRNVRLGLAIDGFNPFGVLNQHHNIEGKTKDTIKARLDLEQMGIRRGLWMNRDNDKARRDLVFFSMKPNDKKEFFKFLSSVKFLDGYASNIACCVNVDGGKLAGLKSHDCHVVLQRLLPVDEALLAGPVNFRWMYPIERLLGDLKKSVRNKAKPEGSIIQAWVSYEALTFCGMYLKDVETTFNRPPRNNDGGVRKEKLSVFAEVARPFRDPICGESFSKKDMDVAHWHGSVKTDHGLLSVNTTKTWYGDDPYILATMAKQIMYLDDPKSGRGWKVVQKMDHRNVYAIPEQDRTNDDINNVADQRLESFMESVRTNDDGDVPIDDKGWDTENDDSD